MKHNISILSAAFLGFLYCAGCATIFTGTEDEIYINSNPEGARIFVDGIERGVTPDYLYIKRTIGDREITLELDGYEPRTFSLQKEFNPVSLLNLFVLPGFIVDAATGSIMKFQPKGYDISLDRTLSLNIHDLEIDAQGKYIIPHRDGPVAVTDDRSGITIVVDN